MNNPFVFGHIDNPASFVNRQDDILRLRRNIENKINTIIVSPRRWGKSSLVKVLEKKSGLSKNYVFCYIDMFSIANENDFYNQFSNAVLHASASKMEEMMTYIKNFLASLKPVFTFESDGLGQLKFEFSQQGNETTFKDVLNLPERIAKRKKKHLVVCIDEFQNLSRFSDPLLFQQRLRSVWQYHQNVTYILYGSKRSMLSTMFEKQSMPFYKFGDVFYLQKIDISHWIPFIQRGFRKAGKKIAKSFAVRLVEQMDAHTYYVQQLAHILWNNTEEEVTETVFDKSIDDIIARNAMMYENIFDNLSINQIKVLKMLILDHGAKYTGAKMIQKYGFGSSAIVIQALKALENKEVIDRFEGTPQIMDPVLKMWMRKRIVPLGY